MPTPDSRLQPETARPPRARLDVWLWRARVAKTRALAAKLVTKGRIRVNGQRETAPGRGLLVGDTLTIALEGSVRVLEVRAFGERRGPAAEARQLFEDMSPPPARAL